VWDQFVNIYPAIDQDTSLLNMNDISIMSGMMEHKASLVQNDNLSNDGSDDNDLPIA